MGSQGVGRRAWKLAALTAAMLLVLAPASGLAKKKHKKAVKLGPVVTATATGATASDSSPVSTATANCPPGKQAIGGGFSAPVVAGSAVVVHDSYLSAWGSWTVTGQVADGSGAVTAYVYCRNSSVAPIADVSNSTSLHFSGDNQSVTSTCPAGTRLIGGGFQGTVPAANDAVIAPEVNQATSPSTWTVTGVQNQDGTLTMTAHAYCMTRIAAPLIVTQASSGTVAQFGPLSATTPACPVAKKPKKGKKRKKKPARLLSAGGFATSLYNGSSPLMVFGQARIDNGGWFASAVDATSATGPATITSQGICV